mgnify:CR=1 FL=1
MEKLPNGIQSIVKERGGGFSEGQAQRLSIARALLRKSPILRKKGSQKYHAGYLSKDLYCDNPSSYSIKYLYESLCDTR